MTIKDQLFDLIQEQTRTTGKPVSYTDMIRYIIRINFNREYDHTTDRGYYACAFCAYDKTTYMYNRDRKGRQLVRLGRGKYEVRNY